MIKCVNVLEASTLNKSISVFVQDDDIRVGMRQQVLQGMVADESGSAGEQHAFDGHIVSLCDYNVWYNFVKMCKTLRMSVPDASRRLMKSRAKDQWPHSLICIHFGS